MTDVDLNQVPLSASVPEAIVLSVVRPLLGRRRHEIVDIPGRAGSWIFTEEAGDRVLTVELDLKGDSFDARRDACRRLAAWADPGAVAALIVSDEPDRYHDAILEDDADPAEWLLRAAVTLNFRVGPYALGLDTTIEEFVIAAGSLSDTLVLPDDVAAEPILEIDPDGNGFIDGFTVDINGDALTVDGPFATDEIVTVSSISDTVTIGANGDVNLTGAFDPADVRMSAVSGRFPLLQPGSNDITLTMPATADPALLRVIWRRRYR